MNSVPSDPEPVAGQAVAAQQQARVHDSGSTSCGELLRHARERRGLSLQQVAQVTKIPLRHLQALERDDFAALPAGMYRRAEVRAYADAVGLDRTAALRSLDSALEPPTPRVGAAPPPPAPRRGGMWIAASVVVAIGATALAIWPRQQDERDTASRREAGSLAADGFAAPHTSNHDLVATSGGSVELARDTSSPVARPAAAPPLSTTQSATETLDAAPAPSTRGPQLTVSTEPAGARVTVNGVGWGMTPVTIRYLEPGAKRVRVTREGYLAEERLIEVGSGSGAALHIPMQQAD